MTNTIYLLIIYIIILGLDYLSHTYVAKMYRNALTKVNNIYDVECLNIFGNIVKKQINLNESTKTNAFQHRFSNILYNKKYFYVSLPAISDLNVQQQFENKLGSGSP